MAEIVQKHFGKVKDNKLLIENKDRFADNIMALNGKDIELIIAKRRKPNRSKRQNRYLWGVVYDLIAEHTGHTPKEVHDVCKYLFLQSKVGKFTGIKSTADLNTVDFGKYIDEVVMWASIEFGIYIPPPDTVYLTDDEDIY